MRVTPKARVRKKRRAKYWKLALRNLKRSYDEHDWCTWHSIGLVVLACILTLALACSSSGPLCPVDAGPALLLDVCKDGGTD